MTALSPLLETFFTERLISQRRASPHTVASYRDAWCLLLEYAQVHLDIQPAALRLEDLDAPFIGAFLDHLERVRKNSVRTRNARLAAVRSFFRFASLRVPEHGGLIARVLAIPDKRRERAIVCFLDEHEVTALLAAPDRTTPFGRRDHALLALALQTGLRVSELTGLCCGDLVLTTGAHVRCLGKGRKSRSTPLTAQTVGLMAEWSKERVGEPTEPLFPSRSGARLSTDAVALIVTKHTATASVTCPSLGAKQVSPHVLRHTSAMRLLQAGVDCTVIALWLGHESIAATQAYLHADLSMKERALDRTAQPGTELGRYTPPDRLLAFLSAM
jgi:site-specific recombinase XerD